MFSAYGATTRARASSGRAGKSVLVTDPSTHNAAGASQRTCAPVQSTAGVVTAPVRGSYPRTSSANHVAGSTEGAFRSIAPSQSARADQGWGADAQANSG